MKKLMIAIVCCMSCSFSFSQSENQELEREISFYETDLVCRAVPEIGCGSASKPILYRLMEKDEIDEAWLNRTGTVIGVVWTTSFRGDKNALVKPIFDHRHQEYRLITGEDLKTQLEDFKEKGQWYLGDEVDELSEEEFRIITERGMTCCSAKSNQSEDMKCNMTCCTKSHSSKGCCIPKIE